MTIRAATPYLILNGNADNAIELYQSALSAKVESKIRFGDMDKSCPAARRELVMHAALRIGNAVVMLSDGAGVQPTPPGGSVSVALDFDDGSELRRCFDALAKKGTIIEPVFDAPWGALFGVLNDQFGISWMFNAEKK